MGDNLYTLLAITYAIVGIGAIVLALYLINRHQKKKYHDILTNLERDKNLIVSAAILTELNKVENLINNEELREIHESFKKRFLEIKDVDLPRITDELIELDDLYEDKKYKDLERKLAKIELEIVYIKKRSNFLLREIKEISLSEEKNRETVTKLKGVYREIYTSFNKSKDLYEMVSKPIELQFETIDKLFSAFEIAMENNSINEVGKIVKALDDTIGNLKLVVEEAPSIIVMGKNLIPKKIEEIKGIYNRLIKTGFNLDYLNFEHNVKEAEKKIADIFDRLKVLNLEDSTFDLKTMIDYFDSLYNDFENEKLAKKTYDDLARTIGVRTSKTEKVLKNLNRSMEDLQYSYDLTDEEVNVVNVLSEDLGLIIKDYDVIIESGRSKSFPYSRLCKELEQINVRLAKTEDNLDYLLRTIGSLKDDELRAREQLEEIKGIYRQAKKKINSYKLPVIPKNYYIELIETEEAIAEVVKELELKPISMKTLNTRVDTARDLVLKLYITTKETTRTAYMAEASIVYGNRYRATNKEIEIGLEKSENFFYKGNYRASLEHAISSINIIEPGIHKKLLERYEK
jgi:septation ring formation regulator